MVKKYFLCLFFVVSVVNVCKAFAFPQEDCPEVLFTTLDKDHQRFRELSPEAQNMLQIASIIAQVTHSNDSIPVKVNIYHVLLATLTKIQSANEAIYRLNLVDIAGGDESKSALFVVLKNLGILRDFQKFLLEEIGLNSSNPEPFEFQLDRSLLLNLNEAVLTSTKINYDKEVDRLWNLAIREKEEEIRYIDRQNGRILQLSNTEDAVRYINIRDKTKRYDKTFRIPTFPEHFFLASLHVDLPIFHFLSEYFDGKTPAQIKDTLYPLIDQAKQSFWNFSKKKKRNNSYTKEQKAEAIALVIKREKEIGVLKKAVAEVAELKKIPVNTLRNWVFKHKKEHKLSKNQKKYSEAEKEEAIALVIKRKKEMGGSFKKNITEVAEQKNIRVKTLSSLVYEYKKEHKLSKSHNAYSEEEKAEAIHAAIEMGKKIGVVKAITKVSKQKNINDGFLGSLVYEYKRDHKLPRSHKIYSEEEKAEAIALVIKREKEIGLKKAIAEVSEQKNIPFNTLTNWVRKYKRDHKLSRSKKVYSEEEKAEAIDLAIEMSKKIGVKKASAKVAKQKKINRGVLERLVYKYKRHYNLPKSHKTYSEEEKAKAIDLVIKRSEDIGFKEATLEIAEKENINPNTLSGWVSKHKKDHKLSKSKKVYSEEEKAEAIHAVIEMSKTIGVNKSFAKISEQKNIPVPTLERWVYKYKREALL